MEVWTPHSKLRSSSVAPFPSAGRSDIRSHMDPQWFGAYCVASKPFLKTTPFRSMLLPIPVLGRLCDSMFVMAVGLAGGKYLGSDKLSPVTDSGTGNNGSVLHVSPSAFVLLSSRFWSLLPACFALAQCKQAVGYCLHPAPRSSATSGDKRRLYSVIISQ
ncbi:hypothetical protein NMY22_g14349 [Coprinellus aureogranulatus]|nr:hypothetical protein NMY22_g14349 [Coprinellus aureogranulatus]